MNSKGFHNLCSYAYTWDSYCCDDKSGDKCSLSYILWKIMLTGRPPTPALAAVVTVIAPVVAPQQVLALHLPLETSYVPVTEVFTQLLNFFQLEQMNP